MCGPGRGEAWCESLNHWENGHDSKHIQSVECHYCRSELHCNLHPKSGLEPAWGFNNVWHTVEIGRDRPVTWAVDVGLLFICQGVNFGKTRVWSPEEASVVVNRLPISGCQQKMKLTAHLQKKIPLHEAPSFAFHTQWRDYLVARIVRPTSTIFKRVHCAARFFKEHVCCNSRPAWTASSPAFNFFHREEYWKTSNRSVPSTKPW